MFHIVLYQPEIPPNTGNIIRLCANPKRCFALTTKANTYYTKHKYQAGDYFIFGPETRGLHQEVLDHFPGDNKLLIPQASSSRSLNLANCVSIVIYEALRQLDFCFT